TGVQTCALPLDRHAAVPGRVHAAARVDEGGQPRARPDHRRARAGGGRLGRARQAAPDLDPGSGGHGHALPHRGAGRAGARDPPVEAAVSPAGWTLDVALVTLILGLAWRLLWTRNPFGAVVLFVAFWLTLPLAQGRPGATD